MDLQKYSVISTSLAYDKKRNIIKKKYKKNTQLSLSTIKLKKLVDNYILQLKNSKIPIQNIVQSYIEDEFLVYETRHCGKNIIELGFDISRINDFKEHIIMMLHIIKKAIKNNIYFDPHPKNFVFNKKGEIFYVDFYPPYTDNLKEMIISIANIDHVEIIKKNYFFFKKNFLLEHFCGDFLNIDKNSEVIFDKIYQLVKELGILTSSQKNFIKKAKYIRSIEDLRLEKNIFLL